MAPNTDIDLYTVSSKITTMDEWERLTRKPLGWYSQWVRVNHSVASSGHLTNIQQAQDLHHPRGVGSPVQRTQARVQQEPAKGAMVP